MGNQDGTGVTVADSFPANVLTNVTASDGGVVDPLLGTINWNLGGLAAGQELPAGLQDGGARQRGVGDVDVVDVHVLAVFGCDERLAVVVDVFQLVGEPRRRDQEGPGH